MTTVRVKHPYYNFDKLFSFNGTYNFLVGGRGLGKTYGAKKFALIDWVRTGNMFIYLRRYKTELAAKETFFSDLVADKQLAGWDFRVRGNQAQAAPKDTADDKKRLWHTMGYFMALSQAQTQKSMAFPLVKTIIFDEFIIETGLTHYIRDEATVFTNFYSTVDRYQDKTRVLFLANSVSIMNPYFIEYKIRPDELDEFVVRNKGFIVCHFPDSEEFAQSIYQTRFGQFIKDTAYADYAVGNTFDDNHDELVALKDRKARYHLTLDTAEGAFSVWYNPFAKVNFYAQQRRPKEEKILVLDARRMGEGKQLVTVSDPEISYLRTAFRHGRIAFDEPRTRNAFTEIFRR